MTQYDVNSKLFKSFLIPPGATTRKRTQVKRHTPVVGKPPPPASKPPPKSA